MISKIIDCLTWQRGSGSTEGDSSDASSKSSEGRVPYYEYLKALKEEEEVGTPINEFAKVQLEVFDIIDQNNRYHTRIRSNLRTKEADEISAWELYRDTENLGDNLWRAYDLDYKRFTRGHSLLQDFLHEYGDTDRLPQEVILGIEQQASVLEVYREWAMVESWKCSVLHNGVRLLGLGSNDDLGNKVLHLETKKLISEILILSSTLIETVGETMLLANDESVSSGAILYDIIEKLDETDLITTEDKERMNKIRKQRNRVAHDITDLAELEWIDDFDELVTDIFEIMGAINYPIEERMKKEVSSEFADMLRTESEVKDVNDQIDWLSIVHEGDKSG